MDIPVENERDDTNHLKRSSDDEIILNDWHFLDQSEEHASDDDSIEVIDCEVSTPFPSISTSGFDSEDNMEEYLKELSHDANMPEEWMDVSEPDISESHIRTIVPLKKYRCRSRSSCVQESNKKKIDSYGITSKVLYSFILGALASLVFQKYKSSISYETHTFSLGHPFMIKSKCLEFARMEKLKTDRALTLILTHFHVTDLFNSWFPDESLDHPWTNGLSKNCVQMSFERRKNINDVRMQQLNLSMYARHVVGDVYSFKIAELAPQLIREEDVINHLNLEKPIPTCEDNITNEQLPLICKNDNVFFVYTEGINLISAHRTILQFFYEIEKRANSLRDNILILLTESNRSKKSSDSDSYYFVRDCDHLSEHFERTKKNSHSENYKLWTNDDRQDSGGSQFSEATSTSETKFIKSDDQGVDKKIDCGLCLTMATVIENELTKVVGKEAEKPNSEGRIALEKFLESCRFCQTVEDSPESTSRTEEINVDEDDETSVDVDEELSNDENERTKFVGQERKEPILGEWLFDFQKTGAKLRNYYNNVVSGDWLLKLGRARDRLRNAKNKDHSRNRESEKFEKVKKTYQGQYWYKKNIEKIKYKFKTVVRQLKDTKESIANKFKELKSKFKNKFCK